MIARPESQAPTVARFRARLFLVMMLVIATVTAIALSVAQRNLAAAFEQALQRDFQSRLAALQNVQQLRDAALAERSRALVRRPRIHAALEDDALDLLYPSARDELRDVMARADEPSGYGLQADFYRFLDRNGAVISAPRGSEFGELTPEEEARLALAGRPVRQQRGYLVRRRVGAEAQLVEVIAWPVISNETGEPIAALVLGFKRLALEAERSAAGLQRGVWLEGELHLDAAPVADRAALAAAVREAIQSDGGGPRSFSLDSGGQSHLLFCKQLNVGSSYPAAYEVSIYPLGELRRQQRQRLWQVLAVGSLVLIGGFGASHVLARRLSRPVEELAVDSAENRAQREKAEAALELTNEELQRAARFSADASHQLKTPVTVLRAGLEELLTHEHLTTQECHEISALIHQTYRLSGVIEDLLLLSRMDAGRLKIEFGAVNLSQLIESALDDLDAQADELGLKIETDHRAELYVAGEKRYLSLILQNLLENARKYNEPGGCVRLHAREEDGRVFLVVSNTGKTIPRAAQEHVFERFHRGAVGENVPGYGLGLNLARELARLHGGDLRLLRSEAGWTEFEVSFRLAPVPAAPV